MNDQEKIRSLHNIKLPYRSSHKPGTSKVTQLLDSKTSRPISINFDYYNYDKEQWIHHLK